MPKWLPLIVGMALFVLVVLATVLYLLWGGVAGKQRGMVITNFRTDAVVLTLADGQTAMFKPNESQTLFAVKARFPMRVRITSASGALIFTQQVEYKALVDAEFRIGIGDSGILFPEKPKAR